MPEIKTQPNGLGYFRLNKNNKPEQGLLFYVPSESLADLSLPTKSIVKLGNLHKLNPSGIQVSGVTLFLQTFSPSGGFLQFNKQVLIAQGQVHQRCKRAVGRKVIEYPLPQRGKARRLAV